MQEKIIYQAPSLSKELTLDRRLDAEMCKFWQILPMLMLNK